MLKNQDTTYPSHLFKQGAAKAPIMQKFDVSEMGGVAANPLPMLLQLGRYSPDILKSVGLLGAGTGMASVGKDYIDKSDPDWGRRFDEPIDDSDVVEDFVWKGTLDELLKYKDDEARKAVKDELQKEWEEEYENDPVRKQLQDAIDELNEKNRLDEIDSIEGKNKPPFYKRGPKKVKDFAKKHWKKGLTGASLGYAAKQYFNEDEMTKQDSLQSALDELGTTDIEREINLFTKKMYGDEKIGDFAIDELMDFLKSPKQKKQYGGEVKKYQKGGPVTPGNMIPGGGGLGFNRKPSNVSYANQGPSTWDYNNDGYVDLLDYQLGQQQGVDSSILNNMLNLFLNYQNPSGIGSAFETPGTGGTIGSIPPGSGGAGGNVQNISPFGQNMDWNQDGSVDLMDIHLASQMGAGRDVIGMLQSDIIGQANQPGGQGFYQTPPGQSFTPPAKSPIGTFAPGQGEVGAGGMGYPGGGAGTLPATDPVWAGGLQQAPSVQPEFKPGVPDIPQPPIDEWQQPVGYKHGGRVKGYQEGGFVPMEGLLMEISTPENSLQSEIIHVNDSIEDELPEDILEMLLTLMSSGQLG